MRLTRAQQEAAATYEPIDSALGLIEGLQTQAARISGGVKVPAQAFDRAIAWDVAPAVRGTDRPHFGI